MRYFYCKDCRSVSIPKINELKSSGWLECVYCHSCDIRPVERIISESEREVEDELHSSRGEHEISS